MSVNQEKITIPPELEAGPPFRRCPTLAVRAFVAMLLARIEELETRLGMTPQNSSLPSSSEHPHAKTAEPKPKSKRKRGGQKEHKKHQRTLVPPSQVAETIPLKPDHCRRCGKTLAGNDPEPLRQARAAADRIGRKKAGPR